MVYRNQAGFDHASFRIAVVVQSMVQSDRSGIMFTVNPVTGDTDDIVIEAILGLGEAAVSGKVAPDIYILDKTSLDIRQKEVSHQEQQLIRAGQPVHGHEANSWVAIPATEAVAQKLEDDQIRTLAELDVLIEDTAAGRRTSNGRSSRVSFTSSRPVQLPPPGPDCDTASPDAHVD